MLDVLYPNRRHPDAKVLTRVAQRIGENGQIMSIYVNRGRSRDVRTLAFN
jgi:hypothetical protein